MQVFDAKHIKNVVLLGSSKSGKTTLAETMLFEAGLINRRGSIEDNNTVSDYHEIEHERQNSVYATLMHTEWRNYKINIIDTPGLDDFMGEVIAPVRVSDTVIFLINAQHGVEVGTELQWDFVDRFEKPTLFAINQLDHGKADFEASLDSIKERFGSAATLMQYPVNAGEGFNAIIDLLKMTMYKFSEGGGKPEKLPIPDEEKEKANQLHNELVEKAAENDENLMELYFEKGELNENEMRQGLKIGMRNHEVFPIFCVSAANNMGSGRMMGFIDNVAPSSVDTKPEKSEDGKEVPYDVNGEPILFIFKTQYEPNLGKMTFFKVISGTIKAGDELVNHQTGTSERLNQLFIVDGHKRNSVDQMVTGDIGVTLKLKDTQTNHTLRSSKSKIGIDPIIFPEPRIRAAIVAKSKGDEEKMSEVLHKLNEEDKTVIVQYSPELKQLIMSCQGELHMNILRWVLDKNYNLHIDFDTPRIPYRETIQKQADSSYRHKKQSGGAGQFGEVFLRIEPYYDGMPEPTDFNVRGKEEIELEWGGKLVFYNCIVGGAIDARFIPSIQKGIMEKMQEGPLTGSYVRDVRVMVYDGKMHPVDSNDISFKIAGAQAFKQAFVNASPKLLEPINELEVLVPEELMGEVMTDLQTRRSIIQGMDSKGRYQVIRAKTPLSELDRYTTSLRSITQGKANFNTRFAEYSAVPGEMQKTLMNEYTSTEVES